jgi:hypothetical protein
MVEGGICTLISCTSICTVRAKRGGTNEFYKFKITRNDMRSTDHSMFYVWVAMLHGDKTHSY